MTTTQAATAVELHMIGRPLPHVLDDWPALTEVVHRRPSFGDPPEAFVAYNQALGPFPTEDLRRVGRAIESAHEDNDHALMGARTCVIVDGAALAGKTTAALTQAFRETKAAWEVRPFDEPGCDRHIPWVYIEVPRDARGFSVYLAICVFLGMVIPRPLNATTLAAALRRIGPLIGLRGIIIDDTHGMASRGTTEAARLADSLKGVVTGLAPTVVIIGTNLKHSGALLGTPGEQVQYRANWVDLHPWPGPGEGKDDRRWQQLVSTMNHHLAFPRPQQRCLLNREEVIGRIRDGSHGRPGLAIMWIKRAARLAVERGSDLDLGTLNASYREVMTVSRGHL